MRSVQTPAAFSPRCFDEPKRYGPSMALGNPIASDECLACSRVDRRETTPEGETNSISRSRIEGCSRVMSISMNSTKPT